MSGEMGVMRVAALAIVLWIVGRPAQAEDLALYGAGSLSDVMPQMIKSFTGSTGLTVKTSVRSIGSDATKD